MAAEVCSEKEEGVIRRPRRRVLLINEDRQ